MNKKILAILWVVVLSLLLVWCWNNSTISTNEENSVKVKIWVIAPLSWPAAAYGNDAVNWYLYQLSLQSKEVQDSVELIIEDGKCNWRDASAAAVKLITVDKVDVILWWQCSWESMAAWKIAQSYSVPMLSPFSLKPEIHEIWDHVYRFLNGAIFSKTLSDHFESNWMQKIWMFVESTDYAMWLGNKYEEYANEELVFKQEFVSSEKDFGLLIKRNAKEIEWLDWLIVLAQTDATAIWVITWLIEEWLYEWIKEQTFWVNIFAWDPFIEAMWIEIIEWLKEVDIAPNMREYMKQYIWWFKENYEIQYLDNFVLMSSEWLQLVVDAMQAWHTDSQSIKQYFDGINKWNQREWLFGKYYFTDEWEGLWLKGAVYEIQNWNKVFID